MLRRREMWCIAAAVAVAALAWWTNTARANQTDDEIAEAEEWIDSWAPDVLEAESEEEVEALVCEDRGVPHGDGWYQHCVDSVPGWLDLR